jgi:hypothetical protein
VDPTTTQALTTDDIIEYIFETENSDEEGDHDEELTKSIILTKRTLRTLRTLMRINMLIDVI